MKKTVYRVIAFMLCAIMALTMIACMGKEKKIQKEEIPNATWEFNGAKEIKADSDSAVKKIEAMAIRDYSKVTFDDAMQMVEKIDTLSTKDGKIELNHYVGKGSPSYMNGINVYSELEVVIWDLGTYSGTDATVSNEYGYFVDAYVTGGKLYLAVNEDGDQYLLEFEKLP